MTGDEPRRLLIVSHVVHYLHDGRLHAYGPYAKEIDVWADVFEHVSIAAPCREEEPPADAIPFAAANLSIVAQEETGGTSLGAKVRQIAAVPRLSLGLARAMRHADAIHVRCPGNLGLLGVILAPMFSRYVIAKYAGQWTDYDGEAWTVRLQKRLLRRWWPGPVTVYGRWPDQPSHIVPFFTSILDEAQLARAARAASRRPRERGAPLRVLYVGRLSREKHVDTLIGAIAELERRSTPCTCTIVGDGPEHEQLARSMPGVSRSRSSEPWRTTGSSITTNRRTSWCSHRRPRVGQRHSRREWPSASSASAPIAGSSRRCSVADADSWSLLVT
jgi:glycosyltransferase involved in cell wall biosynthesis